MCARDRAPGATYVEVLRHTDTGSPVRDRKEVYYTELEFSTATEAALDRLVFLLDTEAADTGIPTAQLIDRKFGPGKTRSGATSRTADCSRGSFREPGRTRETGGTRAAGAGRDARPGGRRNPARAGPGRAAAGTVVEVRQPAASHGANLVSAGGSRPPCWPGTSPTQGIRMVTVTGRGGIGKTATVCRLLKGMEGGRILGLDGDQAASRGGIVYLSSNGAHQVDYPTLVADLLRLLPEPDARRLGHLYQEPHRPGTGDAGRAGSLPGRGPRGRAAGQPEVGDRRRAGKRRPRPRRCTRR